MLLRPPEPATFRVRIGRRSPPRDTVEADAFLQALVHDPDEPDEHQCSEHDRERDQHSRERGGHGGSLYVCNPARRDVCRLRCEAMLAKVLTTIVWVSVLVLGLLFVVFATPLIFLIDND
jgi:hypothetical protein